VTDATERWARSATLEAWNLVRTMLDNLTTVVLEDAETQLEMIEGLRVLARVTALCSELMVDSDPELPWFFGMTTLDRYVAGPNPDGVYHLCTIDGTRRYRIVGHRGTVTYLGFQILAGTGMQPRRMAGHVSDRDLAIAPDGSFSLVLAEKEPDASELGDATWVRIPDDASAIVVRQYSTDLDAESLATYEIAPLETPGVRPVPTDEAIAAQLTAMAWTIAKLTTMHRTIMPELLGDPNRFVTAEASAIGSSDSTPDNLYMIGTFRLRPDEAVVVDVTPPDTRFWNLTISNIWHECIDVRRRRSSVTNTAAVRRPDGTVRFVLAAADPGVPNWLDTAARHRGFMIFRWLDNPSAPSVSTRVVAVADVAGLP